MDSIQLFIFNNSSLIAVFSLIILIFFVFLSLFSPNKKSNKDYAYKIQMKFLNVYFQALFVSFLISLFIAVVAFSLVLVYMIFTFNQNDCGNGAWGCGLGLSVLPIYIIPLSTFILSIPIYLSKKDKH